MKDKEPDDSKDIKKYVLPPRKRLITIPTDDGGRYEFDFCRPSLKQRNDFMVKWGLTGNSEPKYKENDAAILEFTRDTIRLSISGGRKYDPANQQIESFNFSDAKDVENLDSSLTDILQLEAQGGVNLDARDEWFRLTRGPKQQSASANADVPPMP